MLRKGSIRIISIFIISLGVTLGAGCGGDNIFGTVESSKPAQEEIVLTGSEAQPTAEAEVELKDLTERITIAAVGDIMGHMPQVNSAYRQESGLYDFREHFAPVKEIFGAAHLVIGNLETTLAGKERGFSGYPRFNTPDQLADALAWTGFSVLSTANNHSLDTGEAGLLRTLEMLAQRNLVAVGTAGNQEDRSKPVILERNNIKVGFLAYTYGTNGIPIPSGKDYLVNLIDEELIATDLAKLKPLADIVVVSMHWGDEYRREPNARQLELAPKLISWGADIILGSHPHVLQPMEFIEVLSEEGDLQQGFVIYSLGNFISNQRDRYRDSGVILLVDVEKNILDGTTEIVEVNYIPTWVHKFHLNGSWNYRILPVNRYISKYRLGHDDFVSELEYLRLTEVWEDTIGHLGEGWQ